MDGVRGEALLREKLNQEVVSNDEQQGSLSARC